MSDLLLPFLLLLDDDALAFWCFVSLMQRMGARHNFAVDERGIFDQLRLLGQVRVPRRTQLQLARGRTNGQGRTSWRLAAACNWCPQQPGPRWSAW